MNEGAGQSPDLEKLVGGNSAAVERVGDRIRRSAGPWTPTIHAFLNALRSSGMSEVPQPFGLDDEDREWLSFIPGDVPKYPLPEWIWSEMILEEASSLLRRIHDAAVDFRPANALWQTPVHAPAEVICHNDFAPYNLVFARGHLVGVIDFDTASPGPRIWDFAYLAYRLIPFSEEAGPGAPPPDELLFRLRRAIGAYGISFEPAEVLEVMAIRLEDLAAYTDARAKQTGNPDFAGHAAMYRRDAARVREVKFPS